jgi:hypothetical protein
MSSRWKHDASMYGAEGITRDGVKVIAQHAPLWRKRKLTAAVRIVGPFSVETRDEILSCPDGYLAVDSQGWPFPVNREEFEAVYEAVEVAEEDNG